jgi:hypothetical protein
MGDPGGIVGASDVLVAIGANAEKEVIQWGTVYVEVVERRLWGYRAPFLFPFHLRWRGWMPVWETGWLGCARKRGGGFHHGGHGGHRGRREEEKKRGKERGER